LVNDSNEKGHMHQKFDDDRVIEKNNHNIEINDLDIKKENHRDQNKNTNTDSIDPRIFNNQNEDNNNYLEENRNDPSYNTCYCYNI